MPQLLARDCSKCFKIINPLNPCSGFVMRVLLPSPVSWYGNYSSSVTCSSWRWGLHSNPGVLLCPPPPRTFPKVKEHYFPRLCVDCWHLNMRWLWTLRGGWKEGRGGEHGGHATLQASGSYGSSVLWVLVQSLVIPSCSLPWQRSFFWYLWFMFIESVLD